MLPKASDLEGKPVPGTVFKTRAGADWKEVPASEVFKGRSVVVFSLPGAFTPTCSASHLPRYNELAPAFRKLGIDEVVCISVNDAFVLEQWQRDQHADNIRMLPDGNGQFSEGMGMLVDKSDLGFGRRAWRYSMLVRDGIIEKMFIEPDKPGDPYEVSDAETMLRYLDPKAQLPPAIAVLAKPGCPHCARAKSLLETRGYAYEELIVGENLRPAALKALAGAQSWPQVFIDGQLIGGADQLEDYFRQPRQQAAATPS